MSAWLRALACAWVLAMAACGSDHGDPAAAQVRVLDRAEAVAGGWDDTAPPASGWVPVALTDDWSNRWPGHDGVAWYRLRWHQGDAGTPVGLLLDYVCLANAVYVNGSLVHRDPGLREPLSRSWVQPQYFLLDAPLLREGDNTLLVRVSGLSAYQPGLGAVRVGDPAVLQARHERESWFRYRLQWFDLAVSAALGGLFGMLWLLRRRETVYGWFALTTLLSSLYRINYVASSPWPFADTHAWQAFSVMFYLAAAVSFAVFLLRHADRRWPAVERPLWVLVAAGFGAATFAPEATGLQRDYWFIAAGAIYYAAIVAYGVHAVLRRRTEQVVLAACLAVAMLVSVHDFMLFWGLVPGETYLLALTSPLTLIGMGFVLAYRFATAMRRIEHFNVELRGKVEAATGQVRSSLEREHAMALANTRIGERLNLVRDLHDGFGGSLLAAIARLQRAPPSPAAMEAVDLLKQLRDDLRLVIDTTTQGQEDIDLEGLLAPLRHRWTQRLELAGIVARWHFEGLEGVRPGPARSLDLQRFLQEALTNVLKHSGATRVEVDVRHDGGGLRVAVRDDGRGFDPARGAGTGAGLASLRARAARLGGSLQVDSGPGAGTCLAFGSEAAVEPAHP